MHNSQSFPNRHWMYANFKQKLTDLFISDFLANKINDSNYFNYRLFKSMTVIFGKLQRSKPYVFLQVVYIR